MNEKINLWFDFIDETDKREYILSQIDSLKNYKIHSLTELNNSEFKNVFVTKSKTSLESFNFGRLPNGYLKQDIYENISKIHIEKNSICFGNILSRKLTGHNLSRTSKKIINDYLFMNDPLDIFSNHKLINDYEKTIENFINEKNSQTEKFEKTFIYIFETKKEIIDFLYNLKDSDLLSIDVETVGDTGRRYITCISISYDTNNSYVIPEHLINELILNILSRKKMLFHNSMYDLTYFNKQRKKLFNPFDIEDTYILSKSLNNDGQHGLEKLVLENCKNKKLWKKYKDE